MTSPNAATNSIWDAASYAGQQIGNFVAADPNTLPAVTRPLQTAGRLSCEIWGNRPWDLPVYEIYDGTMREMCEPYLGDNSWDAPISGGLPFTGGQCPGTVYTFDVQFYKDGAPSGPLFEDESGVGPISITKPPRTDDGDGAAVVDGNGDIIIQGGTNEAGASFTVQLFNVTPAAGQPDDCGNPRPSYDRGPNPPPQPPPGRDVNIGPFVVPVFVGDFDIDVTGQLVIPLNFNGDLNLDLFGQSGGGSGQGEPPDEGPQLDTDDGGDEDAPPGRWICAAQVQIVTPYTRGVTQVGLEGGDILTIPRHGVLTFEDERGFDSDPVNIRLLGQRFDCPFKEGAKKVRITMNEGARAIVTLLLFPEGDAGDDE